MKLVFGGKKLTAKRNRSIVNPADPTAVVTWEMTDEDTGDVWTTNEAFGTISGRFTPRGLTRRGRVESRGRGSNLTEVELVGELAEQLHDFAEAKHGELENSRFNRKNYGDDRTGGYGATKDSPLFSLIKYFKS